MNIKPAMFVSILLIMQPTINFSNTNSQVSHVSSNQNDKFHEQQCHNSHDDFSIDFDALDQELDALNIGEKKSEKQWWITKQIKNASTKLMIKLLLTYIAVQETCTEQWETASKKMYALSGLLYGKAQEQQPCE